MITGKLDKAKVVIGIIAKRNKVQLPANMDWDTVMQAILDDERERMKARKSIFTVFQYPRYVIRCLLILVLWFTNTVVYYGVSLNITSLLGNIFLNNSIAGLLEIPSYTISTLMMRWGRKPAQLTFLIITAVCLLAVPWIDSADGRIAVVLVGKFAIAASFGVIYVYTPELYPTAIRNSGMGFSSMIARIGSMIAPYIVIISEIDKSLAFVPMIIYGALAIIGTIAAVFLPETVGRALPEHITDVIQKQPRLSDKTGMRDNKAARHPARKWKNEKLLDG